MFVLTSCRPAVSAAVRWPVLTPLKRKGKSHLKLLNLCLCWRLGFYHPNFFWLNSALISPFFNTFILKSCPCLQTTLLCSGSREQVEESPGRWMFVLAIRTHLNIWTVCFSGGVDSDGPPKKLFVAGVTDPAHRSSYTIRWVPPETHDPLTSSPTWNLILVLRPPQCLSVDGEFSSCRRGQPTAPPTVFVSTPFLHPIHVPPAPWTLMSCHCGSLATSRRNIHLHRTLLLTNQLPASL